MLMIQEIVRDLCGDSDLRTAIMQVSDLATDNPWEVIQIE